ncbi:MAG TPA: acetate kinase [Longimicrobiales bacterium]|nr:acetate kinase [Longimicrobiales bacterium]
MNILVLNLGSSTLKFQLIRTDEAQISSDTDERLARGVVERIGGEAVLTLRAGDKQPRRTTAPIRTHTAAVQEVLKWLISPDAGVLGGWGEIDAVGHRVVHGGEEFQHSTLIDEEVERRIQDNIDLAPLHNPHNLKGIRAVRELLGAAVPQAAVFDTAFHHTLPDRAYLYAIPYSYYRRHKVRRYGFHGTSHRFVAYRYRKLTGTSREDTKLITMHLGNGCSACAIDGGDSIDTSMGFTPLEGLVMGTRSGDLDPAILEHLAAKEGLNFAELDSVLNKQSGLLGISGLTNDMRELIEEAEEHLDRRAWLAIEIFAYRAKKYIGSYLAALGGAAAVVFTGGIGQNSPLIRSMILDGMQWAGLGIDEEANAEAINKEAKISCKNCELDAWVIPTDEELLIARDTARLVLGLETRY